MTVSHASFMAAMFSAILAVTDAIASEQRVVLLQSEWTNTPPHYVTIQGGRVPGRLHVMFKAGRHAPSDEWILHEVGAGQIRFESRDPFYKGWYLNIGHRFKNQDFGGAYQAILYRGAASPDDLWRLQSEPEGLFSLKSCNPIHKDLVLQRGCRSGSIHPCHLLLTRIAPHRSPEYRFKIIDLPR